MKCYQYDNQGYFKFVTDDYEQGLPHNATYVKPPEEKEGHLIKFNGESWEYEEIPKEEVYSPTQQDLLNQLNAWLTAQNNEIANNLSRDLSSGFTLKEAQAIASEDTEAVIAEYAEKLAIIQAGGNPFEEVPE